MKSKWNNKKQMNHKHNFNKNKNYNSKQNKKELIHNSSYLKIS